MKSLAFLLLALAPAQQPRQQDPAERRAVVASVRQAVEEGRRKLYRRPAEALADFDRVVALAPEWGLGHALRALALTGLRRDDEATTEMALAERLAPDDPIVHQHAGARWLTVGDYAASVRSYTRSLALRPDNIEALDGRAQAHTGLGQMDAALADLGRITAAPNIADVYYQRARILAHLGREADAIEAMSHTVTGTSRYDHDYLTRRGDFLRRFGRHEEAAAAFRAAMRKLNERADDMPARRPVPWAMEIRLSLMVWMGRAAEAVAFLDDLLRHSPGNAELLAARCWVRMEANVDLAPALADCDRALAAEPANAIAGAARARLFLRLERWAEAEAAFNDLLYRQHGRSEANALYGRGLARIRRGNEAEGRRDLQDARRRRFDVAWEFGRLGLDL
jgi:tetratricopeptide (TPR) repeat protein